ncbi:unnamed protein product [Closterium sp. Naga37s-1]|nr:unnamed protein product [Closterium sp. Naga37s-1]
METCAICLEDYEWGDRLRLLPCSHEFHVDCVDQWLSTRRLFCPVCKRDAHPPTHLSPSSPPLASTSSSSTTASAALASSSSVAASTALFVSSLLYPLIRSFSPLPSLPTASNSTNTAPNPSNSASGSSRRTRPSRSSSSSSSTSSSSSSLSSPSPHSPTNPITALHPPGLSLSSFPPSATPPTSIPTLPSSHFPTPRFIAASTASSSSLSPPDPSREPFLLHHPSRDSDDEETGEIRPVPMPGFTPPSPLPSHLQVTD